MGYIYNKQKNCFVKNNEIDMGLPQLMWHITNQCRLKCKFCFSAKSAAEVNLKDLDLYIEKFKALKVQKIDLSGGEPLLYTYFPQICDALYEAGICITVTTRAVGLDSNINWILDNLEKFTRVIISIDVPLLQSFAELSSADKSVFSKTIGFMQKLKDKQCAKVRINTVVTSYLLDECVLSQIADTIEQYSINEWCLMETHPANKKDTFEMVKISHSQFCHIVERATKIWGGKTGRQLLIRKQSNYTNYWVLYPNGILAKHTDGKQDGNRISFLNSSIDSIINETKDKIWLPEDDGYDL